MEIDNEFLKSCRQPRPDSEAHVTPHLMPAALENSWACDGSVLTLFADYEHTGNAYACFQQLHGLGRGPQPARRLEEHVFLFVLEGVIEAYVGSQTIHAETDTTIFVPRGEVYWYTVTSQTAKVLYIVSSADTFDARKTAEVEIARTCGEPARYLGLPSTAAAPDVNAFLDISNKHGLEHPGLAERGWQDSRKFGLSNDERKLNKRPESENDLAPFVNSRSADSSVWYIGQLISFYMRGTDTGGIACLFEGCPPRGFAPPPHIHLYEHETFFLRSGSIKASCAGTEVEAHAPALLFLPRGLVHIFVSTSDDTKMLSWTNPTDSKRKLFTADVRIFELLGEPAEDLATPPPPTGLPDFETAIKIGLENGIVFPGMADPEGQGWEVGAGSEETES